MFALLPTLILSANGAAVASSPAPAIFEFDGQRYRAVDFQRGTKRIIRGKRSDGTKFRFVVNGDRVTGTVDEVSVEFAVSDAR